MRGQAPDGAFDPDSALQQLSVLIAFGELTMRFSSNHPSRGQTEFRRRG